MFDYDINCFLLSIFESFLHNLFTKANILPNVIKINERIQLSALLTTFKTMPNSQLTNLQFVVVLHGAYFSYSGSGPDLAGGRPEAKLAWGSLGGRL